MVRLFLIGIVGELAFQAAAQANPPTPEFMGSELSPAGYSAGGRRIPARYANGAGIRQASGLSGGCRESEAGKDRSRRLNNEDASSLKRLMAFLFCEQTLSGHRRGPVPGIEDGPRTLRRAYLEGVRAG
jgi:hypothetical protein